MIYQQSWRAAANAFFHYDAVMPATDRPQLIVGTAGHIDHGKSRLVHALTATDPDRLPEEKARGMTIDLGFAYKQLPDADIWFVDVPGHERFIRNMVAGATGVDLALLVIAADDSVMPQTREHAEVLQLLGLRDCLVALTKCDLVDEEWAEVVEDDARTALKEIGLAPVAFVQTSAATGAGLADLEAQLGMIAAARARSGQAQRPKWFRLPVDRAFTVPGRGTVVTGSLMHGHTAADDELELQPVVRRVRVRGLQSHHEQTQAADRRMRLAVNLANVALDEIGRGDELATPGYLTPATRLDVRLTRLRMPGKTLRKRVRLRLHLATREVLTELRLLESPTADPVTDVFAQLRTSEPIVGTCGQRFILRDETGSRTLGGGQILRPVARPWSNRNPAHVDGLSALATGDDRARVAEVLRAAQWEPLGFAALASRAALADAKAAEKACVKLASQGRAQRFQIAGESYYLSADVLSDLAALLTARLKAHIAENPRAAGLPRQTWPQWMPRAASEKLRTALAEYFIQTGVVALAGDFVVPPNSTAQLSEADAALLDALIAGLESAGFQPPTPEELAAKPAVRAAAGGRTMAAKHVVELLDLGAAQERVVFVAPGLWLTRGRYDAMIAKVVAAIKEGGPVAVSEIRSLLDSTRKYVVPLCEHLDKLRITKRVGDKRKLGPNAPA